MGERSGGWGKRGKVGENKVEWGGVQWSEGWSRIEWG